MNLRSITLFSQLSGQALADLETLLQPRDLAAGDMLFRMGDPGDEMFIVEAGGLAIFTPDEENPGHENPIRVFGPGDSVGEMALIDRQPRSLSARAVQDTHLLVLAQADLERMMQRYLDVPLAIVRGLSERIRYTTAFLDQVHQWIGRVAEGQYEIEAAAHVQDWSLAALAADFTRMAAQVKQREQDLRRQVEELQIVVDEVKKQKAVREITESEYFQSLRERVQELRRRE